MADETAENVEVEAKELGWVPKDEFRGDETKWVSAEQFLEHGKQVMPLLRKNNERLTQSLGTLQQQINQLKGEIKARDEDFDALQEAHNEEIVRRSDEVRKDILSRLKAAKRDNDTDAEVELTDQLTQITSAKKEAEGTLGKEKETTETTITPEHPAFITWKVENPWYNTGGSRMLTALGEAAKMREEGTTLIGKPFFDELDRRLAGGTRVAARSKVEGSRGGSSNGSSGNGRTYSDLPAEAKAQCDTNAKKFVHANGTGRFKTEADYRKHFIQNLESTGYFS